MAKNLENRLAKLEAVATKAHNPGRCVVIYQFEDETAAEAKAKWELQNGPITEQDTAVILVRYVTPGEADHDRGHASPMTA